MREDSRDWRMRTKVMNKMRCIVPVPCTGF